MYLKNNTIFYCLIILAVLLNIKLLNYYYSNSHFDRLFVIPAKAGIQKYL
ncbi:hypothetical protein MCHI_003895 [Candidatus Magnetoovum chiemensis]|nr:hypothetical protein MCHI_003895 [Candidatus Magnetoovum chiemensis]